MRTCASCGRENPDERDFCECGEYLRWEPTGYMPAVTPDMVAADPPAPPAAPPPQADQAPPAAPPPPQVEQAPPPPPSPGNGHEVVPQTAVQQPVPGPTAGASITLRLPDRTAEHGEVLAVGVEPGQRERVLAMVRNQSGIVDNYELRVEGVPEDWWSIFPDTVYLVPFGSSGTYEQEVEVHLHPPRTPEAEARIWELRVAAHSKAHGQDAVSVPLTLGILPYTETATKVRPERAKGRRKADFTVDVSNRANAPVVVALEGSDPDGELQFGFDRPPAEVTPGQTVQTTMRVKPPKQVWIGRAIDKRFEVKTLTGEEAAERLAAEPEVAPTGPSPAARRGRFRIPGVSKPQMFRPQVYEPGVNIGPGGINFRAPQLRAPQMRGPQVRAKNVQLSDLKKLSGGLGGGAAAAPAMPLLPSQGVFRQKAWLPWWLVPVLAALAALLLLLYMLLPQNVEVPDVVGAPSAFEAEKTLTEAELKVAPQPEEQVTDDAEPGTVIGQTPAAGEKAEKDSEVSLLIAIGNGNATVPEIVGLTAAEAEQALREAKLTLGQASPQPLDPAKKISSQIPAADEVVKEGTPVDVFFPEPGAGDGEGDGGGGAAGGAAGGAGGGGGGGGGGEVTVPPIDGAATDAYAQTAADEGLVPETAKAFDSSKLGTLFATEPVAGTKVPAGSKVTLLVSGGFPELAFDNDKDILRVNGATGKKLDPVADSSAREKDPAFSFDGTQVAYMRDTRVFLANLRTPDAPAIGLTAEADEFADLAWAPTADVDVLAMGKVLDDDADRDLCLGRITRDGMTPQCLTEPDVTIGGAIHWAPNGRSILAGGVSNSQPGVFGVVRWTTKQAFSPDPADWSAGKFVTDTSKPNEGVKEAALSPDGKQLALIARTGDRPFELMLAEPGDFLLDKARATRVRACKLAWRPDGRELVVVQSDEVCNESVGSLVRLGVKDVRQQRELNASGDNPVFQPLTLGG